ncbi:MAG TPA: hypothetical protein VK458_02880, partial [Myxococcaceae bacterium]|nr:hypothetical protein [Myxococcaceae bacterium]
DTVDSALVRAEQWLVQVEGDVLRGRLRPEELTALEGVRREREALGARLATLPTNLQEMEARRARMQARVDELDREAFQLSFELQSMGATSTALRQRLDDTRAERTSQPEEEKEFLTQLHNEEQTKAALEAELKRIRSHLADERASASAFVSGEDLLRGRYREVLQREHALLAAAEERLSGEDAALVARTHETRQSAEALRTRVDTARYVLRAQVQRRGEIIKGKVLAEQRQLQDYHQEVASVSGDARHMVGRIAFESIQKVRKQFYDLVLKADVGLVDVAFTRKQDKTTEIQKLSSQKDDELQSLETEFKEVLEDAN